MKPEDTPSHLNWKGSAFLLLLVLSCICLIAFLAVAWVIHQRDKSRFEKYRSTRYSVTQILRVAETIELESERLGNSRSPLIRGVRRDTSLGKHVAAVVVDWCGPGERDYFDLSPDGEFRDAWGQALWITFVEDMPAVAQEGPLAEDGAFVTVTGENGITNHIAIWSSGADGINNWGKGDDVLSARARVAPK